MMATPRCASSPRSKCHSCHSWPVFPFDRTTRRLDHQIAHWKEVTHSGTSALFSTDFQRNPMRHVEQSGAFRRIRDASRAPAVTFRASRGAPHVPAANQPNPTAATIDHVKEHRPSDGTIDPRARYCRHLIGDIERAFAFHPAGHLTAGQEVRPSVRKIRRFRFSTRRAEAGRAATSTAAITRQEPHQRFPTCSVSTRRMFGACSVARPLGGV